MRTNENKGAFLGGELAGLGIVFSLARKHFLVLLVVAYAFSHFVPGFGQLLRKPFFQSSEVSFVNVMLSCVLLTLGLSAPLRELKQVVRYSRSIGSFYALRLAVVMVFAILSGLAPASCVGIFVGFIVICAAPTAASSASWSLQLGSSRTTTIALILGTTLFSVLLGPLLLTSAEMLASPSIAEELASMKQMFTASFVLPWVVFPVIVGMSWRSFAPLSAAAARSIGQRLNPVLLLLLNYANAASSFPKIAEALGVEQALTVVVGTIVLFSMLTFMSSVVASRTTDSDEERLSQSIGTSMSNTGLMLLIATLAMPDRIEVHLPIVVYTFVQHLGTAWRGRTGSGRGNESPEWN